MSDHGVGTKCIQLTHLEAYNSMSNSRFLIRVSISAQQRQNIDFFLLDDFVFYGNRCTFA